MGLILDSSLLIADEREGFDLPAWLRSRPREPAAVSVITFSELWFGFEVEVDAARARRRRRWIEKLFRRFELVPMDTRVARAHARIWSRLSASNQIIGPGEQSLIGPANSATSVVIPILGMQLRPGRGWGKAVEGHRSQEGVWCLE